jgi:ElaB/YqjD/DUF883 family membrane-anchored ribosome-binding protein
MANSENQAEMEAMAARASMREAKAATKEDLREMADSARAAAVHGTEFAKEAARTYYSEGKERVLRTEDEIEAYVRAHPMKAMLICGGIGALLGFLCARR